MSLITIDYTEAVNSIFSQFYSTWRDGRVLALIGYEAEVRFQGVSEAAPVYSKFWVRISHQIVRMPQVTISNCEGQPGKKRYRAYGIVFIQLFCPMSVVNNFELGKQLAVIARSAYRGKSIEDGNIQFRNVRIQPLDPEEKLNRFNIVAEVEYDELG